MVVISASIINKSGKILIARQFLDISRLQIEGLLGSFLKLIDTERQHTFIENDSVRFVYHPLENLYLVLVTPKESNLVEDIECLRMIQKVVQHYCPFGLDEGNILKVSFEIVFALDDLINQGYRESATLSQIITYSEMESADERLFKEKQHALILEAKEQSKRKQAELDKKRSQDERQNRGVPRKSYDEPESEAMGKHEVPYSAETREVEREAEREVPIVKKPSKGMNLRSRGKV